MRYEDYENHRQDLEYTPMDRGEFVDKMAALKAEYYGGEQSSEEPVAPPKMPIGLLLRALKAVQLFDDED